MAYRKIIVENEIYEYVIGKTHVKIKGIGAFLKEDIGDEVDVTCKCCGLTLESINGGHERKVIMVWPVDIAAKIKESLVNA